MESLEERQQTIANEIKNSLNYTELSQEVIKYLRGPLSQRKLSEQLGFIFNQVGKWESGATQIKWSDFMQINEILKIPFEKPLRHFFNDYEGSFDTSVLLNLIFNVHSLSALEDKHIQNELKKWLSGKTTPTLDDFLKVLDFRPALLIGFLMCFVDCSKISILKLRYAFFKKQIDAVAADPNVIYVSAALKLNAYKDLPKHDDQFIANQCGCSLQHAKKTLSTLLELGMIFYKNGKYHPDSYDFSFSHLRNSKVRYFNKYSMQLAAANYPLLPGDVDWSQIKNAASSSVRVNAISKEASFKIDALISRFHEEVAEIVQKDQLPKDHVQVIVVNNFPSCMVQKNFVL